ncbi:MAG: hypothetical protein U0Q18_15910 [Bryobacteraceae bacterium]
MPSKDFLYHGHAVAVRGEITRPIQHVVEGHARCGIPDRNPGHYTAEHPGHTIPEILTHGPCHTEVRALPEDEMGYFRTEVRGSLENLQVLGDFRLTADRITLGIVSVYRRHWSAHENPSVRRVRVLPIDCSLGNLSVNGRLANEWLPAPFHYSAAKREAYLMGDNPDPQVESEIQDAVGSSAARFIHIPNFGRIFFGEWGIGPQGASQDVHEISMLRLAMGSPVGGNLLFLTGQGDGAPPPP